MSPANVGGDDDDGSFHVHLNNKKRNKKSSFSSDTYFKTCVICTNTTIFSEFYIRILFFNYLTANYVHCQFRVNATATVLLNIVD